MRRILDLGVVVEWWLSPEMLFSGAATRAQLKPPICLPWRSHTLCVLHTFSPPAPRSKIEVETRHVLGGKNINELYADDDAAAEASGAEDEGAEGASSADEEEEAAPAP